MSLEQLQPAHYSVLQAMHRQKAFDTDGWAQMLTTMARLASQAPPDEPSSSHAPISAGDVFFELLFVICQGRSAAANLCINKLHMPTLSAALRCVEDDLLIINNISLGACCMSVACKSQPIMLNSI